MTATLSRCPSSSIETVNGVPACRTALVANSLTTMLASVVSFVRPQRPSVS
ncbi:MAG: hypothetical protein JO265_01075, partial [Acidimicrobiia bacterium]|nr:hypothetical protein [Acidimicrobiia bacterium]